ncbi:hypothetical protein HDU85_001800 [Gaertneriomyces sp. JEL0708]|nr:hypothetical protein HDU85_001800 [Gaertneriomyces sp. JEL0708]
MSARNENIPSDGGRDADEHMTTKPGGKHPSASASKSTSRPAHTDPSEYPPNQKPQATSGTGKSQTHKAGFSGRG